MPGNNRSGANEIAKLLHSLKSCLETSELFGEDYFPLEKYANPRTLEKAHAAPPAPEEPASSGKITAGESCMDKQAGLDLLYKKFENCRNCRLGDTRTSIVFGMGSIDPKALFIGEGPGYEEDRKGLPFVGKAGILLDNMLKAIGLDRNNAYIANMVKCHPMKDPGHPEIRGNDRPPDPAEISACWAILGRQIEILDPPVICALGATAAKALLKTEEGITRLRGRVFEYSTGGKKIPLIPTYHPAALLRNELLKKDAWEDMKKLRNIISGQ